MEPVDFTLRVMNESTCAIDFLGTLLLVPMKSVVEPDGIRISPANNEKKKAKNSSKSSIQIIE
jgi:hypothetical protein